MKTYEKPVVLANEELAEGVYAASGTGTPECWTIDVVSVQKWTGVAQNFEVRCVHSSDVEHISDATTITVTFSSALDESSYAEFPSTVSGNTITVTRTLLADAYKSGDNMTFKIWAVASGKDQAATEALYVTDKTIRCTKVINVQGGGADEI